MKINKNKSIIFILIFILFLISDKNIYADYGVYGYSGTTITCFSSQTLCQEDATTKNLPVTMCVKISDVDVDVKCPSFSKKTIPVIPTDKPFYFSDGSGIVIGETYADLPACTAAYNTYKTAHPNATINPCKNSQTAAQVVTNTINEINALKQHPTMDTVYTLLAPIPGLGPTAPTNIGDYFNKMLEIAIGLCAVLAVIMIVIGGIQYMGDESVFGKTEAKGQITKAILGLLIALGAFAILNTIDPALLGKNGLNIKAVSIDIEEPPILSDYGKTVPLKNSFPNCKGGVRSVQTTGIGEVQHFMFCNAYAGKLQGLFSAAYKANPRIVLTGGSFRSYEEQLAIRTSNCSNPLTTPAEKCSPPTAIPGTSLHEQGLALDLKCDGNLINFDNPNYAKTESTRKCFDWLKANAGTYGFANFPKENWHWSTGGSGVAGH